MKVYETYANLHTMIQLLIIYLDFANESQQPVGLRFVLGTAPSQVSISPNQNSTMAKDG